MGPAVTHFSTSQTLYLCSVESLDFMIQNKEDSREKKKKNTTAEKEAIRANL